MYFWILSPYQIYDLEYWQKCQSVNCHLILLLFLSLESDVVPLVLAVVAFAFGVKPKNSLQRPMSRKITSMFSSGSLIA